MNQTLKTISLLKKLLFEKASRSPKTPLPEMKPDLQEFLKPSDTLKFVWFGHSTLLLNLDGQIILIDPVFSDYAFSMDVLIKRFQAPVLKLEELLPIDVIVISHDHYDHLDKKTILHFKDSATKFIVPRGVGNHLTGWGIPEARIVELNLNDSTLHNGLTFTATPAQHFSGRGIFDRNKTLWSSWVIQGRDQKIFYSGDSGYGDHFRKIGDEHGPFDVTFIENGQYNENWPDVHMHPEETIQAHLDLNGQLLVPVHWGMFDLALHHWNEPVTRTHKMAKDWEIPFFSPKLGQIVDIGEQLEQREWWIETKASAPESIVQLTELSF